MKKTLFRSFLNEKRAARTLLCAATSEVRDTLVLRRVSLLEAGGGGEAGPPSIEQPSYLFKKKYFLQPPKIKRRPTVEEIIL